MPGAKGRSGGARQGSGPIMRRFTLPSPAAIYLRELTRSRLGRKDVTKDEVNETLEGIVREYAVLRRPDV